MFSGQAGTVASITLRATIGRKRAFLFALPPVILVLVTALLKLAHPAAPHWPSRSWASSGSRWCCRSPR